MRLLAALLVLLSALAGAAADAAEPVKLGVLAYRSKDHATAQWQPLAGYLERALGRPVTLTVHDLDEMNAMVARHGADAILTNPANFVLLQQTAGVSAPLATLITDVAGHEVTGFGGTIFTRADRADIRTLADLAGKRVAVASLDSFGTYQIESFEIADAGLPLPRREDLVLTGLPQDGIVDAVLSGRAEVGFLRAGVLEAMAAEGRIALASVKIINRQNIPSYPYALSTRLYPEWPVAVLPQVDRQLATQLTVALLSLRPDSPEAHAAGIHGFTTPANYDGVEAMLRRLRHPPFDRGPEFTVADLWARYGSWMVALSVLVVLLAGAGAALVVMYRHSRRALHETERLAARHDLLLSSLGEGVYGVDASGVCTFVNPTALSLLGLTAEQVIGADQHALFHSHRTDGNHYPVEECPIHLTIKDGKPRDVEDAFLRDGQPFPVRLGVTPMRQGGKLVGAVVAFQDISARKDMEAELQRSYAELEQFAYAASHDMREPLRMISSFLALLERRLGDGIDDEAREFLSFAMDGARRMDRLIVGLLDYSRIGRGGEGPEPVVVAEALDEALANLSLAIDECGARIEVATALPTVNGYRRELVRLLQNLVGNALKYRKPDCPPAITVSARPDGPCWEIAVADNGIGMAPEHFERIFRIFQRLHGAEVEGCGIGLASCRKIVERHGGHIWVESEPGTGSTFRFTLCR
ncbi:MAG: PhnD/SsuA/transferrin family substrate-binding protein [Actinomycetota bacterium]